MLIGQRRRDRQPFRRFRTGVSFATIMVVALAGCNGGGVDDESTTVAESTPGIEPSPTPTAQLGAVIWSTGIDEAGAPVDRVETFSRDAPVIYAVVEVEHVTDGEVLTAAWSIDDVSIDDIDSTVTVEVDTERGWVSFSLAWEGESLWPVGTLGIAIAASSGSTTTGLIQITSS